MESQWGETKADQLVSLSDVMKAFWKQSDLMKDSAKAFWKYLATQMVHLLKKKVPMKQKEASIQLAENLARLMAVPISKATYSVEKMVPMIVWVALTRKGRKTVLHWELLIR